MRIGSLFSGIGGLELGLEMAGLGETVWQVEKDAFCRAVLAKHWPNAQRFENVTQVGAQTLSAVDIVCGGFPCQDVSSAGKRAGLSGARSGLWFEFHRVVRELRPNFVLVENVASGARAWVDTVLEGLGELGYACLPIPLSAVDVGAPHKRARIFVVAAHADAQGKPVMPEHAEMGGASEASSDADRAIIRNGSGRRGRAHGTDPTIAAHAGWRGAQPDMVRMVHGVSRELDKPSARISALGNAVVPQCAKVVGHVLRELIR
jgi:DNA (cytosine-5)-methyltransferase 1